MIQGPGGLGSTGGKHRTEGVLVRGTEPSLGSIDRECRASGVSVANRKTSANTGIKEYLECYEREFKESIYTEHSASYRSASLSYYDHWQYSIISISLHLTLLPYCLIALLLVPDLL